MEGHDCQVRERVSAAVALQLQGHSRLRFPGRRALRYRAASAGEPERHAASDTASLCAPGRCVLPIKASQGIVVNGGLLIPVRLLGQALGRPVTYDQQAHAVRVR